MALLDDPYNLGTGLQQSYDCTCRSSVSDGIAFNIASWLEQSISDVRVWYGLTQEAARRYIQIYSGLLSAGYYETPSASQNYVPCYLDNQNTSANPSDVSASWPCGFKRVVQYDMQEDVREARGYTLRRSIETTIISKMQCVGSLAPNVSSYGSLSPSTFPFNLTVSKNTNLSTAFAHQKLYIQLKFLEGASDSNLDVVSGGAVYETAAASIVIPIPSPMIVWVTSWNATYGFGPGRTLIFR